MKTFILTVAGTPYEIKSESKPGPWLTEKFAEILAGKNVPSHLGLRGKACMYRNNYLFRLEALCKANPDLVEFGPFGKQKGIIFRRRNQ